MGVVKRVVFPDVLVQRARDGDDDAFIELFGLVRLFILRLCKYRFGLRSVDAEDLFQEIILSLSRNLPRVGNVSSWLFVACFHALRKYDRSMEVPLSERKDEAIQSNSLDSSLMLWDSVFKLSQHCKLIVLRLIVQEYTEVEAAREFRMNDKTVHAHKKKCLVHLRKLYVGGDDDQVLQH